MQTSYAHRWYRPSQRTLLLVLAVVATIGIAWADVRTRSDLPLGMLFVLPAALAGSVLRRWQVVIAALVLAVVAELADSFQWSVQFGVPRDVLYFAAYLAVGLYLCELRIKRQLDRDYLKAVTVEMAARRDAEEQLRLLVANSSIGIVLVDETGHILQANGTAERLYCGEGTVGERLEGLPLEAFVPSLARIAVSRGGRRHLRTMMQCQGLRHNGEPFLADVWFSTYETQSGARMTAMVVDTSDDVRDREEANLEQMLKGSRLLVGAVSHEIRNVCAAIGLVQANLLGKAPELRELPDFLALQQLTAALERMASVELSQVKRQASQLDLKSFVRDLRIIATPSLRGSGIEAEWAVPERLPEVWADHQSLLQVCLNVLRNAQEALAEQDDPHIRVEVSVRPSVVELRVADNGMGVDAPERLFHPFSAKSGGQGGKTGFGLYLSRAMMNSFRGELTFEGAGAQGRGAVFALELMRVDPHPEAVQTGLDEVTDEARTYGG